MSVDGGILAQRVWPRAPCQISKKDSGVYEVVLKDDRGKDTSTLNLTDQGEPWSHKLTQANRYWSKSISHDDQICPLSRFQRLDEWSFQFYRWEDERSVHAINISVHESFLIWIILFQNWYLNSSQFLHPAEDHEHWWGRPTLHLRQLLQRFTPSDVALQVGPTPASQSVCSLFKSISYTHSSWRIHGSTWEWSACGSVCTVVVLMFLCFRDSAIAFSDRVKSGVVGEQLWLQITEPTEKDTGKYAIEFHDGKAGLRRTVELSGQGETFDDRLE